ncbi:metallopeptidase [Candidatus Parcubacteria bacterium]|nr:MAG: metallopeptidase [Candidatus Parcubacteria bacterium]
MDWQEAPELKEKLEEIVSKLKMDHLKTKRIHCFRTTGSKARAYARIWSFPKIFQSVLNVEAAYIIEVLSERFDKLSDENKTRVIIHELLHIPKNFSGSLLPHKYGKIRINKEVEKLYKLIKD